MRIAMVGQKRTGSREGGVEVVVSELARRMAARGHEVTCYDRRGAGAPSEPFEWESVRDFIFSLSEDFPGSFKVIELQENKGPGFAAARAIEVSTSDFVARLDSDDIAKPRRIELQLAEFKRDPSLSCVGSLVVERQKGTGRESLVELPETHEEFCSFARRRCPCRQSTLLMHREAVLAVGNYRELRFAEDWDICNRMVEAGYRFYNIQEPLVTMMVDDDYYARRGGVTVLKRITSFKFDMLRKGQMSLVDFAVSAGSTAVVSLMPNSLREFVYEKLLRGGAALSADLLYLARPACSYFDSPALAVAA